MAEFYIRKSGALAAENGYPVVAIYPNSKRPMGRDWNHNPLSKEECETFYNQEAGAGILCGFGRFPLACVDIDVSDEAIVKEMLELMSFRNTFFTRTGRAPRKAVIVRTERPIRSFASRWFEKDGSQIRVEVLGEGKQFVAYHIHEKTHKPYEWDNFEGEPADTPIEYVPLVTEELIRNWIESFERIAQEHGYKAVGTESYSTDSSDDLGLKVETEKCGLTISSARRYLKGARLDKPTRDSFLKVGMALHFEFDGSEKAKLLWDEWARDKEGYRGFGGLSRVWASFKRKPTDNPLTMRWIIKEYYKHHDRVDDTLLEGALAVRIPENMDGGIKCLAGAGGAYIFNGVHWDRVFDSEGEGIVADEICKVMRERIGTAQTDEEREKAVKCLWDFKRSFSSFVSRVYKGIGMVPGNLARVSDFDRATRYFGVANGDLDLLDRKFLPPDKDRMISLHSEVAYDPQAECPLWRTNMELWVGKEVARFLQILFGYTLLGEPARHEYFVILFGEGCNGKSTMMRILSEVLGQYYCPINAETYASLAKPRSSVGTARADLIALKGARMVVAQESDEGAILNDSSVKAMTGGDPIVARQMYSSEVERIIPTWTTFLATNHIPRIKATDNGLWRRLVFVEFPRNFDKDPNVKRDPGLSGKLRTELPGILNWLLEGLTIYLKEGLVLPDSVIKRIAGEKENSDVLARWFKERVQPAEDGGYLDSKDAWVDFTSWARAGEEDIAGFTKTLLTRRLRKKVNRWKRLSSGHRLFGIKLKPDLEDAVDDTSWE